MAADGGSDSAGERGGARPSARARLERSAPFALAALLALSLPLLVHPWYEPTSDGPMYVATARSLLAGEGYTHLGLPFRIRPPGFPALLAPVLGVFGTSFLALNAFVSAFGWLAAVLLFLFARRRVGALAAAAASLALWLSPGFRSLSNQVMSDVPGLALLLACLLLERRTRDARDARGRRGDALLGAAIGLSAYVRSMNLLLLPAVALARLLPARDGGDAAAAPPGPLRARAARVGALVLAAALVQLPWAARERLHRPPAPADQTYFYDYSTGMWHTDGGDPSSPRYSLGEVLGRAPERAAQVAATLGGRMTDVRTRYPEPRTGEVALALALAGCVLLVAWRRRAPAELFALLATGVVLVYFDYAPRLMLPVWALALVAALEVLALLGRRLWSRVARRTAAPGERPAGARAGAALATAGALALLLDADPRPRWPLIRRQHESFAAYCRDVEAALPPGARVATMLGWHYTVYLERPVHSLGFAMQRAGRVEACEALFDRYGIDTVVLTPLFEEDRKVLPWFRREYPEPVEAGRALLFHVRPRAPRGPR